MKHTFIYDREGHEINALKWASLSADADYLKVAQTFTPNREYLIWTIWLGVDSNHGTDPEHPLIFMTSVFDGYVYNTQKQLLSVAPQLYASTELEALQRHEQAVAKFSALAARESGA